MKNRFLNFRIDKLTSSIENRNTGEIKTTKISVVEQIELRGYNKKTIGYLTGKT